MYPKDRKPSKTRQPMIRGQRRELWKIITDAAADVIVVLLVLLIAGICLLTRLWHFWPR